MGGDIKCLKGPKTFQSAVNDGLLIATNIMLSLQGKELAKRGTKGFPPLLPFTEHGFSMGPKKGSIK